jgi:glutamyl-tRNA synthetase
MSVIVRFAPSPTGIPHVGNIRTALFNYFFAKSKKGKFILRIEDTDQARKVDGAVEAIEQSLSWLGISWDKKIIQSGNLDEYKTAAKHLVEKGFAKEEEGAVRFLAPEEGILKWTDAVGHKEIEFKCSEVEDFVILKSDGFPTYHLANVVDDHAEGITHVIRGEDWIPSTPKHILLYKAFGWEENIPVFVHVPNIHGTDGKKLSKRRGAKSVLDYKKDGILADALLNYLMLLGWSPKDDREILSKAELEKEFELSKINTAPAIFDERKLLWMNGEYIRKSQSLEAQIVEFDPSVSKISNFAQYIPLAQTRMKTLADFKNLIQYNSEFNPDDKQKELAHRLSETYKGLGSWNAGTISTATIAVRDELGASTKDVYCVLTGNASGLPFEQKLEIEGKTGTIQTLQKIEEKNK